jgi:hypothetical protein
MVDPTHTPEPRRPDAPRLRTLAALLATLLAFALIAACAQAPTPDPEPAVLRGTAVVAVPEGEDPVPLFSATLLLIDVDIASLGASVRAGADGAAREALQAAVTGLDVDASTVAPSQVVEVEEGAYFAGIALVESNGSFELVLPDGDALPSSIMRDAADAIPFDLYVGDADCSIVASDPSVLVTQTFGDFLALPAPLFFTPFGIGFAVTISEEIDIGEESDELTSVSVVYATGATTLTTTGTECSSGGLTISADASLVEGWNQMTWTETETGLTIGARSIDESVFSVVLNGF